MKASILIIAMLTTALASCDTELVTIEPNVNFIISKGTHTCNEMFKGFDGTTLKFKAKFDESAIYSTKSAANQADINKLMGFSSCETYHQENSARIGWRWFNEKLEIFAYAYVNGERKEEWITDVPLHELIDFEISQNLSGYYFKVGKKEVRIEREFNCMESANYYLYPYFGGDEKAPHDIKITIMDIEELVNHDNLRQDG